MHSFRLFFGDFAHWKISKRFYTYRIGIFLISPVLQTSNYLALIPKDLHYNYQHQSQCTLRR